MAEDKGMAFEEEQLDQVNGGSGGNGWYCGFCKVLITTDYVEYFKAGLTPEHYADCSCGAEIKVERNLGLVAYRNGMKKKCEYR